MVNDASYEIFILTRQRKPHAEPFLWQTHWRRGGKASISKSRVQAKHNSNAAGGECYRRSSRFSVFAEGRLLEETAVL